MATGSGPPTPRRRTFASDILSSAHSDADFASASSLRSSSYAGSRGMGGPSRIPLRKPGPNPVEGKAFFDLHDMGA
jgi:hypothetical protein